MADGDIVPDDPEISTSVVDGQTIPRIVIRTRKPIDGLAISDYTGKVGSGTRVPGNAPSQGSDAEEAALPDEPGAEAALATTRRDRAVAGAKVWLEQNVPADQQPVPASEQQAASDAFEAGAARISGAVISPNKAANASAADPGAVVKDIARGTVEAPLQIVGGVRDAAQATIDFADWLTGASAQQLQLVKEGEPIQTVRAGDKGIKQELPQVKQPKTATGALVRGVSQFLAGFAGAGKITGAVNLAGRTGQTTAAVVQGALSNAVAFDGHQHRLSNLIEEHPALANPVSAYLAAKPEDGEAEGRFKNALEGLGLGALTEGLLKAVRYVRDVQRASAAAPEQAAAREVAKPAEAKPLDLLGDTRLPTISIATTSPMSSVLPKELAGAKPRYNFGSKAFELEFARDIEKALYITAQGTKSARDADYRGWLKALGYSDAEINDLGPKVRAAIKEQASTAEEGTLNIGEVAPAPKASEKPGGAAETKLDLAAIDHGVPEHVAANALSKKGLTPLTDGKQPVYVNFSRIETADDVKKLIADTTEAFKEDIEAARRGVRSNAQTMEAAGSIDAWEALSSRRHGAPMNAEESLAARRLWEASAAKLLEVADAASKTGAPEDLFQFRKMLAIHKAVQQEVIAARTETARALQAWRIPAGGTGAARLEQIESVLNAYGGSETAQLLAARVAALKRIPDGLSVLDGVADRGAFVKTIGAAKEVWINMLLSNPQTHVVNIMGNAAGLFANMVERAVAARYSQALGNAGVYPGEAAALAYGTRAGTREGLRLFVNALRTGESQFGATTSKAVDVGHTRALSGDYMGIAPDNWMAKAVDGMGVVVNQPVRFLSAEDDFFKAIGYRMEVQAQAFRQATREVQGGAIEAGGLNARIAELVADPPPNIRLEATDAALYLTYTQKPGKFVEALNTLDRKLAASGSPAGQLSSLALRILIPFRNTPANLIKYSFERTPLAPLMAHYREAIARGGADADIARTRMALGTFALLGLLDLALDGHITGAGPKDDSDQGTRATLTRAGWQEYSIKAGGRFYSYKRTDPFGLSIGIAADTAEMINNADLTADKAEEIGQVVAAAAASFGNMVLNKTYMSSMSDFIDVLHNPRKAANFAQRIGSSFTVPNVLTMPRRLVDPYTRYTHDFVTKLRDRIPGLSSSLPAARDMWGRPRSFQSGMGEQYDALSPYYVRTFKPEPIDEAALKNDFNLTMPGWTMTAGKGITVALRSRPEVYSRLLEVRGRMAPSEMGDGKDAQLLVKKYGDQALLPLLNSIVTGGHPLSSQYAAATGGRNGGKDDMVTRIVGDYTRAAKAKVIDEYPALAGIIETKKTKKAAGLEQSRMP